MSDQRFTEREVLDHPGSVEIFCPHMDAWKSSYKPVQDVLGFVERVFDQKYQFRPVGRIEGRRMLVCMLPRVVSKG